MTRSDPSSRSVDYAPAPPRRQRWFRRAIWVALILSIGFSAWQWGPRVVSHARILYWQRQCMTHALSADQVVYEEDPIAAAKLMIEPGYGPGLMVLESGGGYFGGALPATKALTRAASYQPACLDSYLRVSGLSLGMPSMSPPGSTLCFLHERSTPSGKRRLVVVECHVRAMPGLLHPEGEIYFGAAAIDPATLTMRPAAIVSTMESLMSPGPAPRLDWNRSSARVFAGQIDANDPAHFTIRYQSAGQTGVLDGRLEESDRVSLSPHADEARPK